MRYYVRYLCTKVLRYRGIEILPEIGFPVKDFPISCPLIWLLCKNFAQLSHTILWVEEEEAQVDLQRNSL